MFARKARASFRFGTKRSPMVEGLEDRRLFASGGLDPSFSGDGVAVFAPAGRFTVLSMDTRGNRTLVLGTGADGANLIAVNSAGNLDTTFSSDGVRPIPRLTNPSDVFIQPDGKILVSGTVDGVAGVARLLANGGADTSFSGDGFATFSQFDVATGVRLTPSNRIVVGGYDVRPSPEDGVSRPYFAAGRLLANGSLDAQFSGDGQVVLDTRGSAARIAVQGDGRIVLAGTFTFSGSEGAWDVGVIRLTTGGSYDTSFGGGDGKVAYDFSTDDFGQAVDLTPDGKILVGAQLGQSQAGLLRYTADGTLDMALTTTNLVVTDGGAYNRYVRGVRSSFDGSQYYLAYAEEATDYRINSVVVRFDNDGTIDYTFGNLGAVQADGSYIDLAGDGKLMTVGNPDFSAEGASPDNSRVRISRRFTTIAAADRIVYAPSNGNRSNTAIVEGTSGADTITASRLSDGRVQIKLNSTVRIFNGNEDNSEVLIINGGGGNDKINTVGANLVVTANGGYGDDTIELGTVRLTITDGQDRGQTYFGGHGNDTLRGGAFDDVMSGGSIREAGALGLYGEDGDDLLLGNGGPDLLYGGLGRDRLYGGDGDDTLYNGFAGLTDSVPDYLDGGIGNDQANAGSNDAIYSADRF